jgi:hypothetical protein
LGNCNRQMKNITISLPNPEATQSLAQVGGHVVSTTERLFGLHVMVDRKSVV